jgi:formate hydrogenlyase transcriptional activator
MAEQGIAFDSGYLSDLTVGQYRNLLDLAQLAVSHPTTDVLLSTLTLRLQRLLNFDFVALDLYDVTTESIRRETWKAGESQKKCEFIPVQTCASGRVWKTQRSVLVQDLDTEPMLPVFLQSLRQLGVHTYYVFPLTTSRRQLGAIGFGSSQVIPRTKGTLELLRSAGAMIAQFMDTVVPSDEGIGQSNCVQPVSVETPGNALSVQDFDLADHAIPDEAFPEFVGNSIPLQELLRQVTTVAATNATVLLLGETGTGKELVAHAIHRLSPRASSRFITVNCTAIPTELLESELFGHEKGAFTGAINSHVGRLELANRGTLLLDEVGDVPSAVQPKLLRILQDQEFERLGSNRTIKVDVRVIAATNQDLHRSVAEGRFREDLFYRVNVFPIYVPPLRERKSDIPALVRYFVSKYAREAKKTITTVPADAMDAFLNWSWPGNIRELQNQIHRCVILTNSSVLQVPFDQLKRSTRSSGKISPEAEREMILQALEEAGGVIGGDAGAAQRLGMKRPTLYSKMKKLNISPVDRRD